MKLKLKRTFFIGFSFFTILMLWQVYNYYCPLFLKELLNSTYGDGDYNYLIGIIMAMDNILALFMLPIFGTLSDKTHTRLGKRMPYIIVGTLVSLLAFPFISLLYIKNSLLGVIILMGLILVAMNIYRSPSVALMPDVTPKPLRAQANAIINFVGYIGAIIGSILTMIFTKKQADGVTLVSNLTIWPFLIVSFFMLVALIVLVLTIRENKIIEEMLPEMAEGEKQSEINEVVSDDKPLGKENKRNLWLLIFSVFLWYFAFNAVETFGSLYANDVLKTNNWGLATSVLAISSLITFIPSGLLSKKIGRKNSIILGLILMIVSLVVCFFINKFNALIIILFIIAGIGWAIINVNSYPMFVELSSNKNLGKFTGYYYSASQIAQSITPIIIGFIMDFLGYRAFFPYAATFMTIALIIFSFVTVKKVNEKTANQVVTDTQKSTNIDEITSGSTQIKQDTNVKTKDIDTKKDNSDISKDLSSTNSKSNNTNNTQKKTRTKKDKNN